MNRQQHSLLHTLSEQSHSYSHFTDWERMQRRQSWKKQEAGFKPSPLTLLLSCVTVSASLDHCALLVRALIQD